MDFFRASLLIGLCVSVGLFNAKLNNEGQAMLLWSQVAPDQWTRNCTYYFPFRIINRPVPVDATCLKRAAP